MVGPTHSDIEATFITDSGAVRCDVAKGVDEAGVRIRSESATDAVRIERR